MPAPTSIDELLDMVRKSGVVEEKRLGPHVDKLRGFGCGADDYLIKPFEMSELTARVFALLRRGVLTIESHDHFATSL